MNAITIATSAQSAPVKVEWNARANGMCLKQPSKGKSAGRSMNSAGEKQIWQFDNAQDAQDFIAAAAKIGVSVKIC